MYPQQILMVKPKKLKAYNLHLFDTSEFLKSGGSIFCMKNQGWFKERKDEQ
jgi:N-dimethylarginine dimethylaminohydrolase